MCLRCSDRQCAFKTSKEHNIFFKLCDFRVVAHIITPYLFNSDILLLQYDSNLCCPVYSDYNHNDYWTKEDIENDSKKQDQIKFYEEWTKSEIEAAKRREARGGLYDWQIFKKDYYGKKRSLHIELKKLYGYTLEIKIGEKDGYGYIVKKSFEIPLSPKAFYIKFIYPVIRKYKKEDNSMFGFISNMEHHEYVNHKK